MQSNQITQGVQDLTTTLFASDANRLTPLLAPNASYTSALLTVHGRSHVRLAARLGGRTIVRRRERVAPRDEKKDGEGTTRREWDERNGTLTIHTHTTYGLPFALPLVDIQLTFPGRVRLTLVQRDQDESAEGADDSADVDVGMYTDDESSGVPVPVPGAQAARGTGAFATDEGVVPERNGAEGDDEQSGGQKGGEDDGKRYYIVKWEEESILDKAINAVGLVQRIHESFVRPYLLTPPLLLLAAFLAFWEAHPLRDGLAKFVIAALLAVWGEMTREVGRRLGARAGQTQGGSMRQQVQSAAQQAASTARTTARQARASSSTTTARISSSASTHSLSRPNPAEHLTPGKATASTGRAHLGHHSGLDAESAKVDGTSYARVAASPPDEVAGQDGANGDKHANGPNGTTGGHKEHHVPTEPDAPSYAAVVAEE